MECFLHSSESILRDLPKFHHVSFFFYTYIKKIKLISLVTIFYT
ncbi:hypothetical protein HMPREF0083_01621 [Aneurinibacillus aneurinilyticus ATCC 12856]|uniref:Uncharacterized protein n=1 Tax=Aneurinibacillus aneurinilyticus ATCC 12856 TaxID=649747 RepID=U1X5P9_ANEAE|nr:hypothetical protein HMPREF0083_01621 [Aneurinibacillus aneurinilyticus ATCC 12856]